MRIIEDSTMVLVEIEFEVIDELPPAKGEAKSMLASGHGQAHRVRRLLEEAARAMTGRQILAGPIGLDVRLSAPRRRQLPDATNMLGGIGDVLQARSTGPEVAHLGALAHVACFQDDNQIQAISYERAVADTVGYRVRIRHLSG